MTAHDGSVRQRDGKSRFVTAILFATAAWLIAPALTPSFVPSSTTATDNRPRAARPSSSGPLHSPESPTTPRPLQTRPIESIRVGSRVLAVNPEVDPLTRAARPEPDWRDWLWLSLEMPAPGGPSELAPDPDASELTPPTLQIELLRPETWVRDQLRLITAPRVTPPAGDLIDDDESVSALPPHGPLRPIYLDIDTAARRLAAADRVAVALAVDLDLPELGAAGTAWVTAVRPCPEVDRAAGEVVTGTFTHPPAERVLDVRFEGEPDPIGVTANHPFWSVERRRFVPIDQIASGERVRTYHGETKRVEQKLPRPGPQTVYNLEVYGEHVYHVGRQGLLAHNNYARQGAIQDRLTRTENKSRVVFRELEVRAVRSLSHLDSNLLRAMSRFGFSPKDYAGNKLVLHHLNQRPRGPLVEMPANRHSIANRIQHPRGNSPGAGLSKAERDAFKLWREDYWRARAMDELLNRGVSP